MITMTWPVWIAAGRLISVMIVNMWAHVMVPTPFVIFTASQAFMRA